MLGGGGFVSTTGGTADQIRRVNMASNYPTGPNEWTVAGVVFEALAIGTAPVAAAFIVCGT
jgi:hypothetical protein